MAIWALVTPVTHPFRYRISKWGVPPPPPPPGMAANELLPTSAELAEIRSIDDAANWAGVHGTLGDPHTLRGALVRAVGGTPTIPQLARLPRSAIESIVTGLRVELIPTSEEARAVGEGGAQGTPAAAPARAISHLEASALYALYDVCLVAVGRGAPAPNSGPAPDLSTSTALAVSRKIKLSSVVDVTAEADIVPLPPDSVAEAFRRYRDTRGEYPHPDHEPTADQLSAVSQLLSSGAPPYVDFSLFGPHGRRLIRKLMFTAFTYSVQTGEWQRQELPGPPNFESWWKSWLVYKTTLLLLDACSPEPLDLYGEHIRSLRERLGDEVWFLIYQADVRMRSEEFERIRRRLLNGVPASASGPTAFDPQRPWNAVFLESVGSGNVYAASFWNAEVREPAFLFLTSLRAHPQLTRDNTVLDHNRSSKRGPPPGGGAPSTEGRRDHKRPKREARPRAIPSPRPPGPDSARAAECCRLWNAGSCVDGACPNGRTHRCSGCGGNHRLIDCNSAPASGRTTYGSGPSKGKGKGKKGKKP